MLQKISGTLNYDESYDDDTNKSQNDFANLINDSTLNELPQFPMNNVEHKNYNVLTNQNKIIRTRWSNDEVNIVKLHFAEYIRSQTYPPLSVIQKFKDKFKILPNRSAVVIKAWIANSYKSSQTKARKNDNGWEMSSKT